MFRVLGPLEVGDGARSVRVGAPMQRALLGNLLLTAGRVARIDELVDRLWPTGDCPNEPRRALQLLVLRVRRVLADFGCTARIESEPGAYRLDLNEDCLDARHFADLVRGAGHARDRGEVGLERTLLDAALGMWRGPVLGDAAAAGYGSAEVEHLRLLRYAAAEQLVSAHIASGHPESGVLVARTLLPEDPASERWRYLLILSLYRSGRRTEALAAHEQARRYAAEELGVQPSSELQRLQQAILRGEDLQERSISVAPRQPCPATLPTRVAGFIGRSALLRDIGDRLLSDARTGTAICGVSGMAGVGKSALALRIAHELRDRFPDGQLYVDLGAHRERPLSPADALARFLTLLGFDDRAIPACQEARAGLFRTRTSGRRLLIMLDDVAGAEQVRALLPGDGHSAVLVTSRASLTHVDGSGWFALDVLDRVDSTSLLATLAGEHRLRAAPEAVSRIVEYCGGLPLALRVVGAQLAARPTWSVAEVAGQLADPGQRLDRLTIGDISVRASIAASYRGCTAAQRNALRLLSMTRHGEPAPPVRAEVLDQLVDARLVRLSCDSAGAPHYRLHELVLLFMRETSGERVGHVVQL